MSMKRICRILSARQLIPIIMYLLTALTSGFTEDALTQGKKLLLNNQPDKAVPLFYKAAAEGKSDPKINLYLGVCYISLGKYAEAEQQLLAGKSKDPAGAYLYSYNLGNVYFLQSRFTEAEEAYTTALAARRECGHHYLQTISSPHSYLQEIEA